MAVSGSFQLTGENRQETIASAESAEHGLTLGIDWSDMPGWASLSTAAAVIVFPFADAEVSGAKLPWVIEPTVVMGLRPGEAALDLDLDLDLELTYSIPGHAPDETFLYVRPTLSRTVTLSPSMELAATTGVGYKVYHRNHTTRAQHWDVALDIEISTRIKEVLSLRPGVHLGWSDLAGTTFSSALFAWGTLALDVEL